MDLAVVELFLNHLHFVLYIIIITIIHKTTMSLLVLCDKLLFKQNNWLIISPRI